jgi:hypothetical protein
MSSNFLYDFLLKYSFADKQRIRREMHIEVHEVLLVECQFSLPNLSQNSNCTNFNDSPS